MPGELKSPFSLTKAALNQFANWIPAWCDLGLLLVPCGHKDKPGIGNLGQLTKVAVQFDNLGGNCRNTIIAS